MTVTRPLGHIGERCTLGDFLHSMCPERRAAKPVQFRIRGIARFAQLFIIPNFSHSVLPVYRRRRPSWDIYIVTHPVVKTEFATSEPRQG